MVLLQKKCLDELCRTDTPDIIALQETRISEIPKEIGNAGFQAYLNASKKSGYAGVMLLCKKEPLNVCDLNFLFNLFKLLKIYRSHPS